MDLGPHAAFIWGAYAATVAIIASLVVWLHVEGRRLDRRIADLEARGIRRRSAGESDR